jgi:hypothetical protein
MDDCAGYVPEAIGRITGFQEEILGRSGGTAENF